MGESIKRSGWMKKLFGIRFQAATVAPPLSPSRGSEVITTVAKAGVTFSPPLLPLQIPPSTIPRAESRERGAPILRKALPYSRQAHRREKRAIVQGYLQPTRNAPIFRSKMPPLNWIHPRCPHPV